MLIEVDARGRIAAVRPDSGPPPAGAVRLDGLVLPGMANAHSHAFHRALRGSAQLVDAPGDATPGEAHPGGHGGGLGSGHAGAHAGGGTFWSWRETMYRYAAALDPDRYLALARAVYAEMALAGITCVGEFHYLHHAPGGARYDDPNAMGEALIRAAGEAGIRITLLDTCYLRGGLDGTAGYRPLRGAQLRFGDGDAEGWHARWSLLRERWAGHGTGGGGSERVRIGAALHSVRAFATEDDYAAFVSWTAGVPRHVHLSEQPAENEACLAELGRTPTRLLAEHGFWGPDSTAVHATHLTVEDVRLLGAAGATVCLCPTTERDLADGIGPARELAEAGCPLALGSDSHAVIDPFEEARALELDERLRTRRRGHWTAAELLGAAGEAGHAALGWPEAGRLAEGALADLVCVDLESVRTAGPPPELGAQTAVFAASAADVRDVVVAGRPVVRDGTHLLVEDVPAALREAIAALDVLPAGGRR
nr:formimidoylglutamate deiminase [Allostreptomyces psammosilenae]